MLATFLLFLADILVIRELTIRPVGLCEPSPLSGIAAQATTMNIIFGTINYDGSDMKNTPLIAALFFIMLLGGGGAAAVGADIDTTIGYDRSDYVGDFRIRCQISKDDLEAEKSWIISEQIDFPLPVHIAHALALEFIRSNVDV